MILAGSYDLGVAKLFAEFANIKNEEAVVTATTVGTGKRTYESIGAQAPFGPVLGFVQLSKGKNEVATANTVPAASRSLTGYTLGAKYNLSKTTYGYASFGSTKLDELEPLQQIGVQS